jgi:hypothetical protein
MTTRTRVSLAISATVILILAAIAATVFFRGHAAPEEVRLLPDAPAVVYVNLKTVRHLTAFKTAVPVQREPEYEEFVRETGFEFERDLNQVAFAIHTGNPRDTRFTEIVNGQYDPQKCSAYLHRISRNVEHYGDRDIYEIVVENRTVRVVLLGVDLVAISNVDDPGVIHGIIDRHKQIAQPFSGPTVVGQHYADVPIGSVVWAIAQIPAGDSKSPTAKSIPLPGGFDLMIPNASTMVASIRILGSVNARAEFVTQSEADAQQFTQQAGVFLNLFRAVQQSAQLSGSDPDVKAVFDSLKIEQQKERAVISASIPLGFLKKLFSEGPPLAPGDAATTQQQSAKPEANKKR